MIGTIPGLFSQPQNFLVQFPLIQLFISSLPPLSQDIVLVHFSISFYHYLPFPPSFSICFISPPAPAFLLFFLLPLKHFSFFQHPILRFSLLVQSIKGILMVLLCSNKLQPFITSQLLISLPPSCSSLDVSISIRSLEL